MTTSQVDIADVQCWILRMAQVRWGVSASTCAKLLHDSGALEYRGCQPYDL